jgi:L-alanine-DL-glutamate epimerase-like enolase superfamily enzyme
VRSPAWRWPSTAGWPVSAFGPQPSSNSQIARETVGEKIGIALDANQVWDVPTAITWVRALAPVRPDWIEEPTSPDDILGTARIRREVRPTRVATGEHVATRVVFKQLLQAGAIDIVTPAAVRNGRYLTPTAPGASTELRAESIAEFSFPSGPAWANTALPHEP